MEQSTSGSVHAVEAEPPWRRPCGLGWRSIKGRHQPVEVDEAWPFGGPSSFTPPAFGGPSGAVPGVTAPVTEDWDMGQGDVYIHNAPAFPKNPMFMGSTKAERRAFMASYNQYISHTNALTANGVRLFRMPLSACI
ncbi:hypothetical protein H257_16256 [Aphanomyces astaci]|uniref:Uncharacterized protein n=1 Tax=Aphanomyces astaci TaxID=112090 RepID=W4FJJ2_APHAT|nr:hypothetical protein H257_16256 [Aphanomyces astaci]ETV67672.1 hypothetical protein H257_16256 [Aphanomyces astaci]|eukprot:XP_009842929.1 hypothetical protein H257_16256 [Aphanomyces astaci]